MDPIQSFDPSVCISRKVKSIQRITANIFRKHLAPEGITDSQLSILFVVSKRPGISQTKICEILILEKSSLSRNLKRLIELNYLEKTTKGKIIPTSRGLEFVRSMIPVWQAAMDEIQDLLGASGQSSLNQVLQLLNTNK